MERQPPKSREQINLDGRQIDQMRCACGESSDCVNWDCGCFARGAICSRFCFCDNCRNLDWTMADSNEAIEAILDINRHALYGVEYTKGCFCKENGCLKNYCECLKANIVCSDKCECKDCKNFEGSEERNTTLLYQHSAAEENFSSLSLTTLCS